jgi:hypothetical protein
VLARIQRKKNPYTLLVGMYISWAGIEISMEVAHELKIPLPHDPANPLLGIHPKECVNIQKRHLHTHVDGSTIHNSQAMELG